MNKLKTLFCAVFTLLLVNTTAHADSANFAGPYIGVSASGYGMQLDGSSRTSPTGGTHELEEVSLGQVAPVTGVEAGYAIPIGTSFLIDVGVQYFSGTAKLDYQNDDAPVTATGTADGGDSLTAKDVSFSIDSLSTAYIQPTLVLSDTSAVYVKVGVTEASTGVTGDVTDPGDLGGTTWAMGTRTQLDNGIFLKTEAGYTDYNGISSHGKGTSVSTDNSYSAEPTVAFGSVSLGFRF